MNGSLRDGHRMSRGRRAIRRRPAMAAVSAGVAAILLTACSANSASTDQTTASGAATASPRSGGTIRVNIGDAAASDSLDPGLIISQNSAIVSNAVLDPLMRTNNNFEATPGLAKSWEANADLTQWTFHLRDEVTWQDGSPFSSTDVVYTFKRWLDPTSESAMYGSLSPFVDPEGVSAPDKMTVVVKLKKPNSLLPALIATNWASKIVKAGTTDFSKTVIGTGPFKLTSWVPGTSWTAVKNPNYWDGAPYVDGLQVTNTPDQASKLQALQAGAQDVTDTVPISLWATVSGNPNVTIRTVKNMSGQVFAFDQTRGPYNNPKVLEALKLATDRNALLQIALQGHGSVQDDFPAAPDSSLYPSGNSSEFNQEKAKSLLAEAGYPNGLNIELTTSDAAPSMLDLAQAWQQVVKPAGINVSLKQLPAQTYWEKGWMATPAFQDYWNRFHPALAMSLFYMKSGPYWDTKYEDPKLAGMLEAIYKETDPAKQQQMTKDVQVAMRDGYSYLIPVSADYGWGQSTKVHGVVWNQTFQQDFRKAWLDT